jgi:TonB family protein
MSSLIVWVLATIPGAVTPASSILDVETVLAKPVTAASVALLVEHAKDPRVTHRWSQTLSDPRPEVRAAAARAINIAGVTALVPAMLRSLETEADPSAGREEIRAIASVGGPDHDPVLIAAAKRLGSDVGPLTAASLAASRGPAVLGMLDSLREFISRPADREAFVGLATRGEIGPLTRAASVALRYRDPALWAVVLDVARSADLELDSSMLATGLRDELPQVKAATCWHLTVGRPLGTATLPAIKEALLSLAKPQDPEVAFPLEMARRAVGEPPSPEPVWKAWLDHAGPHQIPSDYARHSEWLNRLNPDERRAVALRLTNRPDGLEAMRSVLGSAQGGVKPPPAQTIVPPPPGFVTDLLAVTGCRPGKEHGVALAGVAWGLGRPKAIEIEVSGGWQQCGPAARTLLLWSLVDLPFQFEHIPPKTETILAPMDPGFLACIDAPATPEPSDAAKPSDSPKGSRKITAPRKVHDVRPDYPENARKALVQGTVLLEATIRTTGCIGAVRRLSALHPALDLAALSAVAGWRYTPGLLDGKPVPIIMTVSVNFKLQ